MLQQDSCDDREPPIEYRDFQDYYARRWGFSNLDNQQPLLECRRMKKVQVLKHARSALLRGWNMFRELLEDEEEETCKEVSVIEHSYQALYC